MLACFHVTVVGILQLNFCVLVEMILTKRARRIWISHSSARSYMLTNSLTHSLDTLYSRCHCLAAPNEIINVIKNSRRTCVSLQDSAH